jgi:hypothetical protein
VEAHTFGVNSSQLKTFPVREALLYVQVLLLAIMKAWAKQIGLSPKIPSFIKAHAFETDQKCVSGAKYAAELKIDLGCDRFPPVLLALDGHRSERTENHILIVRQEIDAIIRGALRSASLPTGLAGLTEQEGAQVEFF